MKRTVYIPFLTVLLLLATFVGCEEPTPNPFLGTWKVSYYEIQAPNISPQLIGEAQRIALTTYFTFHADSTVDVRVDAVPEEKKMRWKHVPDLYQLHIYPQEGDDLNASTYIIILFNESEMQWRQELPGVGQAFSTLYRVPLPAGQGNASDPSTP